MKNKKKILLISVICVGLLLVLAVVFALVTKKESYRLIKVNDFNGSVDVCREEDKDGEKRLEVFQGMRLLSQDTITVGTGSFLELLADEDKYIGAGENTCFALLSEGNEKEGKIHVELKYGKALFTIEKKLNEKSSFEVETPNAVMSVRGTRFSVLYDQTKRETVVLVYEGIVRVEHATGAVELQPGQQIIIGPAGSQVAFFDTNLFTADNWEEIINFTTKEKILSINRVYDKRENIETSPVALYLYVDAPNFNEPKFTGAYTDAPNSRFENDTPKLNALAERIENEFLHPNKEQINQYFQTNWQRATEILSGGGEPDHVDVTQWFPEMITIEGEEGSYSYQITCVEMQLCANESRMKNDDGTLKEAPPYSFINGENYSVVQSYWFIIYGSAVE